MEPESEEMTSLLDGTHERYSLASDFSYKKKVCIFSYQSHNILQKHSVLNNSKL